MVFYIYMTRLFATINNKYILFVFFLFFSLFSAKHASAVTVNSGFVSGIWYSQTPFFAEDDIRIYTAIQNESGFDITGTIRFYDGEEIIGESEFSSISGHLIEEWADWHVTEGEHRIKVEIVNPVKSSPGSDSEPITLLSSSSPIDARYADIDTDKDRIGNKKDPDDDNDGLTDEEEADLGTNPLIADTDNDGTGDKQEFEPEKTDENKAVEIKPEEKTDSAKTNEDEQTKIVNTLKNILNSIDNGVETALKKIILTLEKKSSSLEAELQDEKNPDNKKSFFKNFYSVILPVFIRIFNNRWAAYVLIFIILVIIWKIFRFFRRRR
ncbi:MAG: hypothetical protein A2373_04345 [Candidatus Magasanikbacteria bacterium RIFOXYB1_FULL_40_15]|uniref:CARDB domain-containing protein n=3 Tax=Candidatus Magasanikiibacteriota TaxID=1752731 RepID=A0A1F6NDB7_9BACT|nr:MAG: hypothetical protein A2373_04345 [Candidatus Magasanikbacteria bacterium RIFOXYB1_FULL_40_15]